jgi:hypothetical protein
MIIVLVLEISDMSLAAAEDLYIWAVPKKFENTRSIKYTIHELFS